MQCLRQPCGSVLPATRPVGRAFTPVLAKADTRRARTAEKHARLRKKLSGTTERPRLAVFKSNEHMYAQVIDDTVGHTLVHTSTLHKDVKEGLSSTANIDAAAVVGKKVAELCLAKNITTVAFDRGGFKYHGRIKAVAEAARAGGLNF